HWEQMACADPDAQVAARRMADGDDPAKLQVVHRGQLTHLVDGQADVGQGVGKTTARVADPAVFDVPCRHASGGEGVTHSVHQVEAEHIEPAATVNHYGNRIR